MKILLKLHMKVAQVKIYESSSAVQHLHLLIMGNLML